MPEIGHFEKTIIRTAGWYYGFFGVRGADLWEWGDTSVTGGKYWTYLEPSVDACNPPSVVMAMPVVHKFVGRRG